MTFQDIGRYQEAVIGLFERELVRDMVRRIDIAQPLPPEKS